MKVYFVLKLLVQRPRIRCNLQVIVYLFATQVRALTCLAEIGPDDLEAMGYHDLVDQVQENLEIWRFLHRLEKLNIPLDYEAFKSQNKKVI